MRKRLLKLIAVLIGLVAVPALGLLALRFVFTGLELCGDDVLKQALSPDGRYVAAALQRDCGATGMAGQLVSLRKSNPGFERHDPAQAIHDGIVFSTDRYNTISLAWKGVRHLVIRAKLADPAAELGSWRDVTISYEPAPIQISHRNTRAVILTVQRLWGADLHGAKLAEADLSHEDLSHANLADADLRSANFGSAILRGAILRGANLARASLPFSILDDADLQNACLRGADLEGAYLRKTRLSHADLRQANLERDTRLDGADLTGANLAGVRYTPRRQLETVELGTFWPNGFDPRQHGAIPINH